MIAIIDYGVGNLRSVQKSFEAVGADAKVTSSIEVIQSAQKIVLPGVGAMEAAMNKLEKLNLIPALKGAITQKKPFLGICVGFQLLFEHSEEGNTEGLGFLKGDVKRFNSLKVPHMGWNQLDIKDNSKLFNNAENLSDVYFCHSYYVQPNNKDIISTSTEYGITFASSIESENIFGVQFHPEKSQSTGLNILKNFNTL